MISFDAIVFDMDGVLFDTETVSARGWLQTGEEMRMADMTRTLKDCTGRTRSGIRMYLQEKYGPDFPFEAFMARTSRLFEESLAREGVRLMEGVEAMLEFLREQKKPIALASSSSMASILHHLRETGIERYFDAIVSGDQVTHGKPDPEIYIRACAMLGREPARCIGVEDSLNGVRAVHAAGMRAVMIPDQIEPTDEIRALTYVIRDSMTDALEWLKTPASEELWDAYTADGRATGGTLRRGEKVPAGLYHAVAETFVRHADGDYLFMRRDERKQGCPGLWECGAGGSVLRGESCEEGARRELREETGLTVGSLRWIGRQTEGDSIFTHYLFETDVAKDSITLQKGETVDYRWISPQELDAFLNSPACVPFLRKRFEQYPVLYR